MKFRKFPIQIYFLDNDLSLSAKYQTNKSLVKCITGCMQALICTRFYFIGLRNKKFYKYYFDKERKEETMERFFPLWPLKQSPKFMQYTSKESKWTRKCKEHYDYVKQYLDILLEEYLYRFGKEHGLAKFSEWLNFDAPKLNIPIGNISKIILPWKVLDIKYRRKNIIEGYRLKFLSTIEKPDIDFLKTKRDIPDFVLEHFKLDFS
jgi:hypothetical protein